MLLRDALLAFAHFTLILALAGCLFSEVVLYRRDLSSDVARLLQRVDACFGIVAGLVVVSGVLRVIYSPKGAAFYLHNPVFWTKIALFVVVGLLSIVPTVHFLGWRKQLRAGDGTIVVDDASFVRIRATVVAEIVILLTIPFFAAMMARGF